MRQIITKQSEQTLTGPVTCLALFTLIGEEHFFGIISVLRLEIKEVKWKFSNSASDNSSNGNTVTKIAACREIPTF